MSTTTTTRAIKAPLSSVFEIVAHIDNYAKAIPHITKVEVLSDHRSGLGTRFKETRLMGKREVTTELEVTEYEAPNLVRFVSESGGTTWDTIFSFSEQDGITTMAMQMDATAKHVLAKLFNLLIKGMITQAIEADMDSVKSYCEASN